VLWSAAAYPGLPHATFVCLSSWFVNVSSNVSAFGFGAHKRLLVFLWLRVSHPIFVTSLCVYQATREVEVALEALTVSVVSEGGCLVVCMCAPAPGFRWLGCVL
jgi:hypothetical protein